MFQQQSYSYSESPNLGPKGSEFYKISEMCEKLHIWRRVTLYTDEIICYRRFIAHGSIQDLLT